MKLVKDSMASSGKFVSGIKQLLIYHNYFVYHHYSVPTILQVVTRICFRKSYFIIVFRVKDCLNALLHLIGFLYIVTWKHRLIVLIPIFHAGKDVFNIPSKV